MPALYVTQASHDVVRGAAVSEHTTIRWAGKGAQLSANTASGESSRAFIPTRCIGAMDALAVCSAVPLSIMTTATFSVALRGFIAGE